jgi:hypothetical protein
LGTVLSIEYTGECDVPESEVYLSFQSATTT